MDSIKLLVLEELWRKDPQSRVFLRLAEELRKAGQYKRAITICKEGIPNHSGYIPALVSLGRSTQALGDGGEAERVYGQVLDLAPDNTHALRGMGQLLADRGAHKAALNYLETLLLHEPNDTQVQTKIEQIHASILAQAQPAQEPEQDYEQEEAVFLEANPGPDHEPKNDSLANLDREFEKAIDGPVQDPDLFRDNESLTGEFDIRTLSPVEQVDEKAPSDEMDTMITDGLKHEKMEHLEEARAIYHALLERHPGDYLVKEHLERVQQLLTAESSQAKKIRVLSNWLDKIKGVYHVS